MAATRSRAFPDPDVHPGGDAFEGVEIASPVGSYDVGSQVSHLCFLIAGCGKERVGGGGGV